MHCIGGHSRSAPEVEDVEVHVDENDVQIRVFRSSGPGGRSL